MIIGALLGFFIGMVFGIAGRSEWPAVIWNASLAAIAATVLMRWWSRVWINNLRASLQAKLDEAEREPKSTR